jgi:1-aminocyclopropane-1-carboxylate deaminase
MFELQAPVQVHEVKDYLLKKFGVRLFFQREDLVFPLIPGNKWRKLKYNFIKAREEGHDTLLTFGGAYSNHIAATAAGGKMYGFKTIGLIRGEECLPLNATIVKAKEDGMQIFYISRSDYRHKSEEQYLENLKSSFGSFYLLPEGGSNFLAVQGCAEILSHIDIRYDIVCCPVGTGATLAGLITGAPHGKKILGFSSLKGGLFLEKDLVGFLPENVRNSNSDWSIEHNYHFGGYAKTTPELLQFRENFLQEHNIPLDLVYSAKMVYGIYDKIKKGDFQPGERILAIHTGGLQGNKGFGL